MEFRPFPLQGIKTMRSFSVVEFAHEIITMQNTIYQQEVELERLREIEIKYQKLLDESIAHAQAMHGQVISLLMNKGEFQNANK